MRSKLLPTVISVFLSAPAYAQVNSCRDLIFDYDTGAYRAVLDYVIASKDSINDGCYFNIAGLSTFKMPDADSEQNKNLGLWFFSRAAQLGYPAGSYNFYRYTYLTTNVELSTILEGLSHLIAASNNDQWRSSALKSVKLGNQIIEECSTGHVSQNCRGRTVTQEQKAKYEASTRAALNEVNQNGIRQEREYKESRAVVDNIVTVLSLGLAVGSLAIGKTVTTSTSKPVDPFQFVDPYPKPMTCLNGTCW